MGGNLKIGDVQADRINIEKIGRDHFYENLIQLLTIINTKFRKEYNRDLWPHYDIFNGSTSWLFDFRLANDVVLGIKNTAGDIDIMINKEDGKDLFLLLSEFESKYIGSWYYYGCNRTSESSVGNQINALFRFQDVNVQIDFELTEFEGAGPSDFARFSHSSTFIDATYNIKGVMHKYILRSLCHAKSTINNVKVLTPASSIDNPKFKKEKGCELNSIRMLKFSVDKGLRIAYEHIEGNIYKEIPTNKAKYITNLDEMFETIFGQKANSENLEDFKSFTGIVTLINSFVDEELKSKIFEAFIDLCFSERAQKLDRYSPEEDLKVKLAALDYLGIQYDYSEYYKNY